MAGARFRFTDRAHGDLAAGSADVDRRRRAVVDRPWTWLRQVHGAGVVRVSAPGEGSGQTGDAAVTTVPGVVLAVQVADCAPVVLLADGGVGVVHAGWRGVVAGVLPAAVDGLRDLGATGVRAVIGPCIRARCYEFGSDDLVGVAAALGPGVRSTTAAGTPALDLTAAVLASLAAAGVDIVDDAGTCTACSPRHFSFRARGDVSRQAAVAWLEP